MASNNVLPNLGSKSITFFEHDLGEASWEHWILASLTVIATVLVAETLAKLIPIFFQRVVKWHEPYHEILALLDLLIATQGIPIERAKELLKKYKVADPTFIQHYGSVTTINEILRRRTGHNSFYRTNFFELLYDTIRPIVFFCGISTAFYIVGNDLIVWITGIYLSSVFLLYGLMPRIQDYICHVILVYTDRLRVSKRIEIPNHDKIGVVLELGAFAVKTARLNKKIVEKLWGKEKIVGEPIGIGSSIFGASTITTSQLVTGQKVVATNNLFGKRRSKNKARIHINSQHADEVHIPMVINESSGTGGGQLSLMNHLTSPQSTLILPIPYPIPNVPQSSSGGSNSSRNEESIPEISETSKEELSEDEQIELFQSILKYGYTPNSHFFQVDYEDE